jgi:hypothetical protein
VRTTLAKLLELGLTGAGMTLILQLPFAGPNKQAARLPPPIAKQVLLLNQMTHPFAEQDVVLPNVDASAPPAKRLNLSRLAKAV